MRKDLRQKLALAILATSLIHNNAFASDKLLEVNDENTVFNMDVSSEICHYAQSDGASVIKIIGEKDKELNFNNSNRYVVADVECNNAVGIHHTSKGKTSINGNIIIADGIGCNNNIGLKNEFGDLRINNTIEILFTDGIGIVNEKMLI